MTAPDAGWPERWRVGQHYGIHVYAGDKPIATFHDPADAQRAVDAVNGAPMTEPTDADRAKAAELVRYLLPSRPSGHAPVEVETVAAALAAERAAAVADLRARDGRAAGLARRRGRRVTAPDARDELREALAEALRRVAPTASVGTGYERIADALLPVVTAWAEAQARVRAAEAIHTLARSLPQTQDREANRLHDLADALAADDRTDPA